MRQFDALSKRRIECEKVLDWRAGIIASTVANASMGHDGKALEPADFFPRLGTPKPSRPMGVMDILAVMGTCANVKEVIN